MEWLGGIFAFVGKKWVWANFYLWGYSYW